MAAKKFALVCKEISMSTIEDKSVITSPPIKVGDCVRRKDGIVSNGIIDRYRWDGQCWLVVHPTGYTVDMIWEESVPDFRSRIGNGKPGELVKCPDAPITWPVVGEQAVNPEALKELYQSVRSALTDASIGRAALSPDLLVRMNRAIHSAHIPQDPPHD